MSRLGFDTDPQGTADNRVAARVVDALGNNVLDIAREIGRDPEAIGAALQVESKRVLLAALQSSDLQGGFDQIFARLDPATAAPEAIDNLIAWASAIKGVQEASARLPGVMADLATISATAAEKIINLSGGIDALTANTQTYFENF